jgi:hypothetical protein
MVGLVLLMEVTVHCMIGEGNIFRRMVKHKRKECYQAVDVPVLLMWATRRVGSCPTLIIKLVISTHLDLAIPSSHSS